jgi:hypothetical protein
MTQWQNIDKCEYPIGDADEAVPVWLVIKDKVVSAWYRNPDLNDCWFESDSGSELHAHLWHERSDDKPPSLPVAPGE